MAATDMLSPYCEGCDDEIDIYTAVVGGTNDDGTHDVRKYELECGHTVDEPDATMNVGFVYMLSQAHPQTIEVNGEIDEDALDDQLPSDEEFSWGFWEILGLLAAVVIVACEKLGGAWRAIR